MVVQQHGLPAAALPIVPTALEKAEAYARLVAERFDGLYESIGFLLGERGPGPVALVTDAMLAHDQAVSMGSAQISPRGVLASGREIERSGKQVLGWWHAHPANTFHSGTDDENLRLVLEDLAGAHRWPRRPPEPAALRWEDGALVVRTPAGTLRLTGEGLPAQPGAGAADPLPVGAEFSGDGHVVSVAYSLVVSASGRFRPYAEMAVRSHCCLCERAEVVTRSVAVRLVPEHPPQPLDVDAMRREVERRVRLQDYGWGGGLVSAAGRSFN